MKRRELIAGLASTAALSSAGCVAGSSPFDPAYPPIGEFIEVQGVRLHYVDEGAGPPIILIHGASGNLRDWTFSMTDRLKDRFRVIAFDRPGHGYSGRLATDGANPAAQARLLAAATAALGVERALIVGHSWGGAVATAWTLDRPDQVAGAVILAGATYPWDGDGGLLYNLGAGALSPAVSAVARLYVRGDRAESVVAGIFAPNTPPPGYVDYVGVELALRPGAFRWNAEDIDGLNDHLVLLSARYGELRAPLEIIHGDEDTTVGLEIHSRPLSEAAQNATLTILEGVGHMPHHAREDRVVDIIDRLRRAVFG